MRRSNSLISLHFSEPGYTTVTLHRAKQQTKNNLFRFRHRGVVVVVDVVPCENASFRNA